MGKSPSTLRSYGTHVDKRALHFDRLPTDIDPDEINESLFQVKREHNTPSDSYVKFTVDALRFCYRIPGSDRHPEPYKNTKARTGVAQA